MVKWISLHAAARKGLPMLGRSLAKQKSNCVFYFWAFFLVWHLVGESLGAGNTHWGVSEGSAGVCERWAHLGYHWVHTGTRAVKQSGSEVHGYNNASPPAHFTAALFFFFSFYWFLSLLLFFSLNRYHNMGNLLKVLTCTDLEQEPNFFLDFESEFSF